MFITQHIKALTIDMAIDYGETLQTLLLYSFLIWTNVNSNKTWNIFKLKMVWNQKIFCIFSYPIDERDGYEILKFDKLNFWDIIRKGCWSLVKQDTRKLTKVNKEKSEDECIVSYFWKDGGYSVKNWRIISKIISRIKGKDHREYWSCVRICIFQGFPGYLAQYERERDCCMGNSPALLISSENF